MVAESKEEEDRHWEVSMGMGSRRSNPPLHNFTLPCGLKWGNQKLLRCGNPDSMGQFPSVHRRFNTLSPEISLGKQSGSESDSGLRRLGSDEAVLGVGVVKNGPANGAREFPAEVEGIATVRKKLLGDFQAATDKMKDALLTTRLKAEGRLVEEDCEERPPPASTTAPNTVSPVGPSERAMPWNLRTRRSGSKQPNGPAAASGESNSGLMIDTTTLPSMTEDKSPRVRCSSATASVPAAAAARVFPVRESGERAKFAVALSRQEIEEDFAAIIRHRPSRRPKKRAKNIQSNLDSLFPGLWLTEISAVMYKVTGDK
ncbi:unnamed protein product [Cuscuta europaea]|uniref:Uncharacterized protein n=1 Tax=Cuscuta europaea TaxID=41803 RepID=A0A9P1ELE0_CUSEU|nr:unnamed protein product [Cuscuta europaea]